MNDATWNAYCRPMAHDAAWMREAAIAKREADDREWYGRLMIAALSITTFALTVIAIAV